MEDQSLVKIQRQLASAMDSLQSIQTGSDSPTYRDSSEKLNHIRQEVISKINSVLVETQKDMRNQIQETLNEFDQEFDEIIQDLIQTEVKGLDQSNNKSQTCLLSQKVHTRRSPLLIKMLKNEDFRTVYHIFIATMIVMCLGEIIRRYIECGEILDLSLFA